MVPVLGSAEEQSWAVFGTTMATCGWKERTPSPRPWLRSAGGCLFLAKPDIGGRPMFSERSRCVPQATQEPAGTRPRLSSTRGGGCSVVHG